MSKPNNLLGLSYISEIKKNNYDLNFNFIKRTGNFRSKEIRENFEENTPYLNPQYVEYLQMSDKEKAKLELIPEVYNVEYDYTKLDNVGDLPSSYNLADHNYLTPL